MKFCLYPVLCVMLMMPFSVSAETDNSEEDLTSKTKRSLWQRVFPRTGDIEGTVLQHGSDTPFVEAAVRIVETDQQQKTGKDGTLWQYSSGTTAVPLNSLIAVQDPVTAGMHPLISDVAGAIFPTEFPAYHRLDLRFKYKRTFWALPVTAFTEILNAYNKQNKIRLRVADKLAEAIEASEFETDTEALDIQVNEYLEIPQFPFTFSVGIIYEF